MGDYEASRGHIGTGYNAEEVSHILSDFRNADFLYAVRARPSPCSFYGPFKAVTVRAVYLLNISLPLPSAGRKYVVRWTHEVRLYGGPETL